MSFTFQWRALLFNEKTTIVTYILTYYNMNLNLSNFLGLLLSSIATVMLLQCLDTCLNLKITKKT